jgi:hypothetical protein
MTVDFPEPEEPIRKVSSLAGRKRERESRIGEEVVESGL